METTFFSEIPLFLAGGSVLTVSVMAAVGRVLASSRQQADDRDVRRQAAIVRNRQAHLAATLPVRSDRRRIELPVGVGAQGFAAVQALRVESSPMRSRPVSAAR